ncbi:2-hydroxyacyl-CoA dehydratase subunit D [Chloroflexota bacterium]
MSELHEILSKMLAVASDPFTTLAKWKQKHGRRIIGCLPMYFPEEIIHASRALPVIVPECDEEPISLAHAHIQTYVCGYARSAIDIALKGKLSFIDGYVSNDICHSTRGLAMMIEWDVKPTFYRGIAFPQVLKSPYAREYFNKVLRVFKGEFEEFMGKKITDASLKKSILVYNKHRALIRRIYNLRRGNPSALTGKQMWAVVASSMYMPKEDHNQLLEELVPMLEARKPEKPDERVRLVLAGGLCEGAPPELFDLIEEIGAVVVDDDLYVGSRYIGIDANPTIKPMDAIADRYLNMDPPCPTRVDDGGDWAEYLINMVKQAKAKGIVTIMAKYCEPHSIYYPHVMHSLKDEGIPELMLETEHGIFPGGQFRTRLEAFLEMIS